MWAVEGSHTSTALRPRPSPSPLADHRSWGRSGNALRRWSNSARRPLPPALRWSVIAPYPRVVPWCLQVGSSGGGPMQAQPRALAPPHLPSPTTALGGVGEERERSAQVVKLRTRTPPPNPAVVRYSSLPPSCPMVPSSGQQRRGSHASTAPRPRPSPSPPRRPPALDRSPHPMSRQALGVVDGPLRIGGIARRGGGAGRAHTHTHARTHMHTHTCKHVGRQLFV